MATTIGYAGTVTYGSRLATGLAARKIMHIDTATGTWQQGANYPVKVRNKFDKVFARVWERMASKEVDIDSEYYFGSIGSSRTVIGGIGMAGGSGGSGYTSGGMTLSSTTAMGGAYAPSPSVQAKIDAMKAMYDFEDFKNKQKAKEDAKSIWQRALFWKKAKEQEDKDFKKALAKKYGEW